MSNKQRLGILKTAKECETRAEARDRIKAGRKRKPLRSFLELADELQVNTKQFASFLSRKDAPKAKFQSGGNTRTKNTWYDPDEVRKWWVELQANKRIAK